MRPRDLCCSLELILQCMCRIYVFVLNQVRIDMVIDVPPQILLIDRRIDYGVGAESSQTRQNRWHYAYRFFPLSLFLKSRLQLPTATDNGKYHTLLPAINDKAWRTHIRL